MAKSIKALLDDSWHFIEFPNEEYEDIKCLHDTQFEECMRGLLNERQQNIYAGDCTKREFSVSESRIKWAIGYMKDNIWNKPK